MGERERRVVTAPMEARAGDGDGGTARTLSGYAALYNSETRIANFREVIAPGAFRSALKRGDDVRGLFNHNPDHVLGRTAAGTLRLSEDARGLRYELDLPDTQLGRDLWTSVRRGDVSQSSFAFTVEAQAWQDESTAVPLRESTRPSATLSASETITSTIRGFIDNTSRCPCRPRIACVCDSA